MHLKLIWRKQWFETPQRLDRNQQDAPNFKEQMWLDSCKRFKTPIYHIPRQPLNNAQDRGF